LDELGGNLIEGQMERFAVIVAALDREVSQRDQQGELVGGGELALAEHALQLVEPLQLRFRARWRQSATGAHRLLQ